MTARAPQRLRARATPLYPGASLLCRAPPRPGPALVAFSDGVEVQAMLEPSGATLAMPAYRTARGADVSPKRWSLDPAEGGARIAARLPDPAA
jgi:hypothetical protein